MLIDVITLFPKQVDDFLNYSIIKRAVQDKKVDVKFHDLRKWAVDARGSVDDRPYGGGMGMILRIEPVVQAIRELKTKNQESRSQDSKKVIPNSKFPARNASHSEAGGQIPKELVVMFDARGEKYNQKKAFEYAKLDHLILICGHYEGFDERILKYVDKSISIGDFVLTGGEIPALVVVDSVVRLVKGVLKEGVVENESYSQISNSKIQNSMENKIPRSQDSKIPRSELEYPQYTRPEEFDGHKVPEVLLSGNHGEIEKWRKGM